ncbi:MAG: GNAT family N-acetyltransferase [Lachnospiraceae bacterium]|nr:GNAT family N-acetyltransferase [Lachnospiraceae bacterium]
MQEKEYTIRAMTTEDYEAVHALWLRIKGFGIRSLDDSKEAVTRFIRRNPNTSIVACTKDQIVGAILCGHDGRRACFYHVCVDEQYRQHGIGKAMAQRAIEALKAEGINKVNLVAFTTNEVGNRFWQSMGWTFRDDLNYYDYTLNEENRTEFVG